MMNFRMAQEARPRWRLCLQLRWFCWSSWSLARTSITYPSMHKDIVVLKFIHVVRGVDKCFKTLTRLASSSLDFSLAKSENNLPKMVKSSLHRTHEIWRMLHLTNKRILLLALGRQILL
jgi:hypothetical protein